MAVMDAAFFAPFLSAEPNLILGEMLNDIAKTASSAGDACRMGQSQEASCKVDELKLRILKVSEMLTMMSLNTGSYPPNPFLPIVPDQRHIAFNLPGVDIPPVLPPTDLCRKRCAVDMENQRNPKALKREPHDDAPIVHTPDVSVLFGSADQSVVIPPLGSSRPPTPPAPFPATHLIEPAKSSPPILSEYSPFIPASQPAVDFGSGITTPMPSASPTFSDFHASWCDTVVPAHPLQALPVVSPTTVIPDPINAFSPPSLPPPSESPIQIAAIPQEDELSNPIGRMSRSNSTSHPGDSQLTYAYINQYPDNWPSVQDPAPNASPELVSTAWAAPDAAALSTSSGSDGPSTAPSTARGTPTDDDEEEIDSNGVESNQQKMDTKLSSLESSPSSGSGSEVPQEYKAEVDRIFFEYLNRICSNLDATDSKGEPIHQTLMAKKMQRLDESPDFRPFKFRIQAFTLAFLEELARQGYPEEKIPMKKIRNYLWRQPYILRFNEDGKKAKSKGNHIWNIEAKKAGDGKWEFRPFHRRLAGNPPSVAYCGIKWSWAPRVWDPQASWQNILVKFSSPSLPAWLAWKDDVLSGIPLPDATDCTITVNATYILDGQEGHLSHTFTITIAPVSAAEAASRRPRRPSMAGDSPRRSTSDSFLCQTSRRSKARSNTTASSTSGYAGAIAVSANTTKPDIDSGVISESPDKRVIRVLQQAAQKVTMEANSQIVTGTLEVQDTLEDLAKQRHVLEQTVDAYDRELSGQSHMQTRRLAVAAQHVVVQAAHTVIADKTGGTVVAQSEVTAIQSVTVSELSDATQDAIAEAVKMKGTATNDVDIIVTATSILKARAPGSPTTTLETLPSLSNSPTNNAVASPPLTTPGLSTTRVNIGSGYTPNLSSLPEYV